MFDMVKQWVWYDWVMFIIRLVIAASLIFTVVQIQNQLTLSVVIVIFWAFIAFSVPWLCLLLNYKAYLVTELILSGGFSLYITSLFPEAYLTFIVPTFLIAANSNGISYRLTGPVTILLMPLLIKIISPSSNLLLMIIHMSLAYAIGFTFHLLIVNHRQNEIIRNQNTILEQYLTQIEHVTQLEERNRLSKDLHDTMGHSYTSMIMGLETLRPDVKGEEGEQKLNSLLDLTRGSFEEVRGYLHQMESPQEKLPMLQLLREAAAEFEHYAEIKVRFRSLGDEYIVSKPTKMALYRCLLESLTNAVRHGQSTEISVTLQFEQQQTRMVVEDNGRGVSAIKEGFGLKAMKERAANLQGQVSVYSVPGEGMVVTCILPRQIEPSDEMIRLLIVDNQAFIRESLRIILDQEKDLEVLGYAADGDQAVQQCEKLQPQLVLMDLDMPGMDGITATQRIKQQWPHVRVLILTTFQQTDKAVEVLRSGADGYLLKSIEPRELVETIRLVNRGGTMIAQDISAKLFEEWDTSPLGQELPTPNIGEAFDLNSRELEILQFLSKGMRYKSIAIQLYLSDGTVRNYASSLYSKLGVRNREEAVEKAIETGLL